MTENRTPKELTDVDSSGEDEDEGSASAASLPTTSCSKFHSARIASMLSSRSEFETELEYRTAYSKVHWSELSHHERASSSEESESGSGDQSGVDHARQYFEELQKDAIWGGFCSAVTDVVLGAKLGEGAQAVIYEAQKVTFARGHYSPREWKAGRDNGYVVKVMKSDCALEDLHRQWPRGLATLKDRTLGQVNFDLYGALVKDHATGVNQFGFVMLKKWGDLRRLIDMRMEVMERNNAKGPSFSESETTNLMIFVAWGMSDLHRRGVLHRDLKASNILVSLLKDKENYIDINRPCFAPPSVADWECSVGVVGTRFWKAPELLQELKDRTPSSDLVFTEEMDVYSFAMTCYEIVTGKLPFEGLPFNKTRDAILDGARPPLPHDMDPNIRAIISNCWDPNPSNRPRFGDLVGIIKKIWLPK